jgi:tetratricopeptide (TPR) repeat protein
MATSARIDELRKKFDENPRRYFAPYANEFRKQGDLSQAIALCRTHLPNQPGHISGHIVLAQALYESRELGEARGVFEQALDLDPENLIALRYLGDIAREQASPTTARAWYQRVLEADPRNDEIRELIRVVDEEAVVALAELSSQPTPVSNAAIAPPGPEVQNQSWSAHPEADALAWVDDPAGTDPSEGGGELQAGMATASNAVEVHQDLGDLEAVAEPEHGDWFAPTEAASASASDNGGFLEFTVDLGMAPPAVPEAPNVAVPEASLPEFEAGLAEGMERSGAVEDRGPAIFSSFGDDFAAHTASPIAAAPGLTDNGPAFDAGTSEELAPAAEGSSADAPAYQDPAGFEPYAAFEPATQTGSLAESTAAATTPAFEAEFFEAEVELEADSPYPVGDAVPLASVPDAIREVEPMVSAGAMTDLVPPKTESAASAIDEGVEAAFEPDLDLIIPDPIEAALESETEQWDPAVGRTPAFSQNVAEEPPAPFVTETMAELYLQQGFDEEALAIYRQLLAQNPDDDTLRRRVEALEDGARAPTITPLATQAQESTGPSVREFFHAIATRGVPGVAPMGAAAVFAAEVVRSTPSFGGVAHVEEAMTQPDLPPLTGGGLSAMFQEHAMGEGDAAAADSLAAAFGANAPVPSPELSLDSLFGQLPSARADAVTSAIRAESLEPSATLTPGPDGEANADIEQFTVWLEGLKKK